jgi:hypothetical protein
MRSLPYTDQQRQRPKGVCVAPESAADITPTALEAEYRFAMIASVSKAKLTQAYKIDQQFAQLNSTAIYSIPCRHSIS